MAKPTLPIETMEQTVELLDMKGVLACMMRVHSVFYSLAEKRLYHDVKFINLGTRCDNLCATLTNRTSAASAVRIARIRLTLRDRHTEELIPMIQNTIKNLTQLTTLNLFLTGGTRKVLNGLGHSSLSTLVLAGSYDWDDSDPVHNLPGLSRNIHILCDLRYLIIPSAFTPESLPNVRELSGSHLVFFKEPLLSTHATIFNDYKPPDISDLTRLIPCLGRNLECFKVVAKWKPGLVSDISLFLTP